MLKTAHATRVIEMTNCECLTEDVMRGFLSEGVPIVFRGYAVDWDCVNRWAVPGYLETAAAREHISHPHRVYRQFTSTERGRVHLTDGKEKSKRVSMRTFLSATWPADAQGIYLLGVHDEKHYCPVQTHSKDGGIEPPLRMDLPTKLDLLDWYSHIKRAQGSDLAGRYDHQQFFMTRGSARTDFHYDSYDNFYVTVSGTRRWTLAAPEATRWLVEPGSGPFKSESNVVPSHRIFPTGAPAQLYPYATIDLGPGDVLFVPACWWHIVESFHDTSQSCSVAFNYFFAGSPEKTLAVFRQRCEAVHELLIHERDRCIPVVARGLYGPDRKADSLFTFGEPPVKLEQHVWEQVIALEPYLDDPLHVERFRDQHCSDSMMRWQPSMPITPKPARRRGRPERRRNPNAGRKAHASVPPTNDPRTELALSEQSYLKRLAFRDLIRQRRKTEKLNMQADLNDDPADFRSSLTPDNALEASIHPMCLNKTEPDLNDNSEPLRGRDHLHNP